MEKTCELSPMKIIPRVRYLTNNVKTCTSTLDPTALGSYSVAMVDAMVDAMTEGLRQ